MNVILPVAITDTNFTYSNIAEPDTGEAFWLAATSYTLGQEVIRPNHKKYKNTLAGADAGLPEVPQTPQRWTESGVSNKWAAADTLRNTQSMKNNVLVMKFMPAELIDSIGLGGIFGTDINITVNVLGSPVYSYSQSLFKRNPVDWYAWFFSDFRQLESVVRLDLPIYANSEIVITITNTGQQAKCGAVVFGKKHYIGDIKYGSSGDDLNFSKFDRTFDGTAQILQRRSIPTVEASLTISKSYCDDLRNIKKTLNAIPTVWTGMNDSNIDDYFELFLIFGIYKQFSINAALPSHAEISLKLEEY
jgi:hypothetical protein